MLWSVKPNLPFQEEGHRGCDRMVVGFTTTYANSAYHHKRCLLRQGVLDITLCDKVCQ